jgi:hypothetical protein
MVNATFEQLFINQMKKGLDERKSENGIRVARLCYLLSKDTKHDMRLVEDYLNSIESGAVDNPASYDIINEVTYFSTAIQRIEA